MDTLESRVERLERQNRALKGGVFLTLTLAVVGGVILMGQASGPKVSDELRTRKLVVVDEAEKPRMEFCVSEDSAVLRLRDEAGLVRAALLGGHEGGVLILFDEAEMPRASLGAPKDGPGLFLFDETPEVRAGLVVMNDAPRLMLKDAKGYRAVLGATELVNPTTGTKAKRSAASLVMFDKENHVIWTAPQ